MKIDLAPGVTVEHRSDDGQWLVSWPGGHHLFGANDIDMAVACMSVAIADAGPEAHRAHYDRGMRAGYTEGFRDGRASADFIVREAFNPTPQEQAT